jgi:hypothetical protein
MDGKQRNNGRETEEQWTGNRGTKDGKQRNNGRETEEQRTVNRGTIDRNSGIEPCTEKGTLGQLIKVRGQRKEDGRTDNVRQGVEDGRQGTET